MKKIKPKINIAKIPSSIVVRQFFQNLYFSIDTFQNIFLCTSRLHFLCDHLCLEKLLLCWSRFLFHYCVYHIHISTDLRRFYVIFQYLWKIILVYNSWWFSIRFYLFLWKCSLLKTVQSLVYSSHILVTFVSDIKSSHWPWLLC